MNKDEQRTIYQCPSCESYALEPTQTNTNLRVPQQTLAEKVQEAYCRECFDSGDAYRDFGYAEESVQLLLKDKEPSKTRRYYSLNNILEINQK